MSALKNPRLLWAMIVALALLSGWLGLAYRRATGDIVCLRDHIAGRDDRPPSLRCAIAVSGQKPIY